MLVTPGSQRVNTTTSLLRPLFCVPNESPDISLFYNLVNLTTVLLCPMTTLWTPYSLFSYLVNTTSRINTIQI